jgi:hypothetical protein
MALNKIQFFRVAALPANPVPGAFYFVKNGSIAESWLTDNAGTPHSLNAMIDDASSGSDRTWSAARILAAIGSASIDPAVLAAAIAAWLSANDIPGAVRYDVAQQLEAEDLERVQDNLQLAQAIAAWMAANGGSGGSGGADHFRGFFPKLVYSDDPQADLVPKPAQFNPPAVWGDYIIALGFAGEPEMFTVEQTRNIWARPQIVPASGAADKRLTYAAFIT